MEPQFYSLDEVSQNNGKNGKIWIVLNGVVYDVTDVVDQHPGGGDIIRECAGKDATRDFDDVGHSSDAKKFLKKYKIGELRKENRPQKIENQEKEQRRSCCSYITCGLFD